MATTMAAGSSADPKNKHTQTPFMALLRERAALAAGWLHAASAGPSSTAAAGDGSAATPRHGASGFYSKPLRPPTGWAGADAGATATLVTALLRYSAFANDHASGAEALRQADWLLTAQDDDGGLPMCELSPLSPLPIPIQLPGMPAPQPPDPRVGARGVWSTSLAIRALLAANDRTHDAKYLDGAAKAGRWIVRHLNTPARQWTRGTEHMNASPAYYTEVCAALLALFQRTQIGGLREAAMLVLDTLADQRMPEGGFRNWGADPRDTAASHHVALTISGFDACGRALGGSAGERYSKIAAECAANLAADQACFGRLSGGYDEFIEPATDFFCPSGAARMSRVWLGYWQRNRDMYFLNAAAQAAADTVAAQEMSAIDADCNGALPGSQPITGPHARMRYPTDATAEFVLMAIEMHEALTRLLEAGPCDW